ncbi:hypothetical protein EON66_01880 [archaeon]|nr:MAG: hypothetical protein EON66_01880 [archaeon]
MLPHTHAQRALVAGAAGAGDDGQKLTINGDYETRNANPGTADGVYGFFLRTDGSVMACAWSAEATSWVDIGVVQEGGAGGGSAPDVDMNGGGSGGEYDFTLPVTVDTMRGMRSLTLQFNRGDDPTEVAATFCAVNSIPSSSSRQVEDFVRQQLGGAGAAPAAPRVPTFKHFPISGYLDLSTVDFSKVIPKLVSNNDALAAAAAAGTGGGAHPLTARDMASVQELVSVLEATSRYHSSTVPAAAVQALVSVLHTWPVDMLLPVVDVLRIVVLHSDGAEVAARVSLPALLLASIRQALLAPNGRPVVLIAARALFNCFKYMVLREVMTPMLVDIVAIVRALLEYNHETVKFAASVLAFNVASCLTAQHKQYLDSLSGTGVGDVSSASGAATDADMRAVVALVDAVGHYLAADVEPDVLYKLVVVLGTCAVMSPTVAAHERGASVPTKLSALVQAERVKANAALKEACMELNGFLSSA